MISMPSFIIPDLLLLAFPFIVIGSRLFCDFRSKVPWRIANIGLILIFALLNLIPLATGDGQFFISNWRVDDFGVLMREVLVLSAILGVWLSKDYFEHGADGKPQMHQIAEFIGAIAFATFGGITVVSACDTLTFFLGLEIATIPMYALTAWNKKDQMGSEAATKYILMGSVATAFELFGFSYLFGFAGGLRFSEIQAAVAAGPTPLLWVAVLFLFCGIGFKLTLFPFYTWAPDVYEGAPTPVTAVLSVTSKATAVAFLAVLVYGPLAPIQEQIAPLIALLAGVTLFVGNLGALKQSRLRRFMAYSSIAQAGYIMVALLGPAEIGKTAIVYYLFVYAVSNYLAFFVFGIIGHHREETFASLRGLSKQNPYLAIALAISMFSLAGIPPLAGFFGKFHLFFSGATTGHYTLVTFAVLNNVLALFYYIQLIKSAWVDEPDGRLSPLRLTKRQRAVVFLLSVSVVCIGFLPFLSDNVFAGFSL
ncbi:MAG: NADH-quinone oxidoreductase subunit N [Fibrobacter sp.]|uniref:NADH-quinone oxidoreductase subunit N n=1 Tax=Fibrobacter sp. UWP2 TaxID=1896216 RepID=UPI0009179DA5|nr:NADH-quinone oxidoreductase subunit N [Fibrobacter sp. UWP2]MBO7384397.1 NADH-quinone oxidoreductase subunit N [Fibrobacter sp.]MCR5379014.1 NADH-quinone oxidoreductase subunit N [Fibrobacter sp.]SHI29178.1 NADH-quinone oxidoreductase subunit N [Fibrobacter sp. UWP2]